jgi:ribosomal protein S18 acetylase RimI-like enzyme
MIRVMTIEDFPAVLALWSVTKGIGLNSYDDSEPRIALFLERNPTSCFVWEEVGEIIGVILAGHDGRRGYIYHAAVREDRRSEGIGTALAEAAIETLNAQGIRKAGMSVMADNQVANDYWEKRGWERRTDVYYRNRVLNQDKEAG